ncbi:MAG: hypothetical protein GY849_04300 [Deltaproteobacteria bacterium]|nr:hypothetical protein [Deltaproteobacteria bacterium]
MIMEMICPFCHFSREIPEEKMPAGVRWITCQGCGQRFEFQGSKKETGFSPKESGAGTGFPGETGGLGHGFRGRAPWEKRSDLGLFRGIYQTFKAVLFSPDAFFRTLTFKGGIGEPLAFGLLLGSLGNMVGLFWQFLMLGPGLASSFPGIFEEPNITVIFLILMALIPIFVSLAIFMVSGILHVTLLIVGGGGKGFEATFRVMSYSQAAQAWGVIPFVGGWIGGIWQLIVRIIGLREIHETSYLKVIMAFLLPVALIFLMVAAALILFFAYVGEHGLDLLKVFG